MLGLGTALSGGFLGGGGGIVPSAISGLELWLQFNKGIVGNDGGASDDGDMADGEDVNSWADQSGNDNTFGQASAAKKPHWETDAADLGGVRWTARAADPFLQMGAGNNISISANENFTIMMRVKMTDFSAVNALIGSSATNTLKWPSNKIAKTLIGGSGSQNWEESSDTLATDTYYIHTLTRTGGADGDLDLRIHGADYVDKEWNDAGDDNADADEFTIDNLGCAADNALPMEGVIKDVIIWKGTALTAAQRLGVIEYIEAQ